MIRRGSRAAGLLLAVAIAVSACNPSPRDLPAQRVAQSPNAPAATLRVKLDAALRAHAYLMAATTANVFTGPKEAAGGGLVALEENTKTLSKVLAVSGGGRVERLSPALWRSHVALLLGYAASFRQKGKPAENRRKQIVADLEKFTRTFGRFVNVAAPFLPGEDAAALIRDPLFTLKSVIELQSRKDYAKADASMRAAADKMSVLAGRLADAISYEAADRVRGDAFSPGADYRASLNSLMRENSYLLAAATEDAQTGQSAGFTAMKTLIDANSAGLAKAFGGIYGAEAEASLLPLWKRHIDLFITYANTARDKAKHEKAFADLLQFIKDLGAYLITANGRLDGTPLGTAIDSYVRTLKAAIDAQAKKDHKGAGAHVAATADHAGQIADLISIATVREFPARFAA